MYVSLFFFFLQSKINKIYVTTTYYSVLLKLSFALSRSYWVGDISWTHASLFLACVLKRGSLVLLTCLGELLTLVTLGCSIEFGPAEFIPLHPLITYRWDIWIVLFTYLIFFVINFIMCFYRNNFIPKFFFSFLWVCHVNICFLSVPNYL